MGRLTKYDKNAKCYLPFSLTDWSEIKIMNKLGELEDVLEKYGIENLEEYISALIEARKLAIEEKKTQFKRYIEEVTKREKIEQELAELKQKAIVPKFEKGKIVYFNDNYGKILSGMIIAFDYYTSSYIIMDNTFGNEFWRRVENLFTTKEEAEQKLAEIGGKDE